MWREGECCARFRRVGEVETCTLSSGGATFGMLPQGLEDLGPALLTVQHESIKLMQGHPFVLQLGPFARAGFFPPVKG